MMNSKHFTCIYILLLSLLSSNIIFAQDVTMSGMVTDAATRDPMIGANVVVKDKIVGTVTEVDGSFKLKYKGELPITLVFSAIGFKNQELLVTEGRISDLRVKMNELVVIGQEIVISASRRKESIMQSPVTIETMDALDIKMTPSANFYDGLADLKGVHMNTSSINFKSINTRGFSTMTNTRFVQLIDGMDAAPPGLNFPTGNIVGISELDIQQIELIPGAASALYGPNAFNGILSMTSKDPFKYQGLSAMIRGGATVQKASGIQHFEEIGVRYAKAFGNRFAFKFNFSGTKGSDWYATDFSDMDLNPINASIRGENSPSYDGVNIYGDEIATTISLDQQIGLPEGTLGSIRVARTGYKEEELLDYVAENYKFDASFHYRLTQNMKLAYDYRIGYGTTIYQGGNRYYFNNLNLQQHKLELMGDNFFVRGYYSSEYTGDSYDSRFAAWNINNMWKDNVTWFTEYTEAYLGLHQVSEGVMGGDHEAAREYADRGRLEPGTPEFQNALDTVKSNPDLRVGAKTQDNSSMAHVEANYNFKNQFDFLDVQVGGNYRRYNLKSDGAVFNDADGPIGIQEYGAYIQVGKKMLEEERLGLTMSMRYDKNENFNGNLSPRASLVYSLGKKKEHNFRASFQTGFRNPETQAQFIKIDLGVIGLIGGTQRNIDSYEINGALANGNEVVITGSDIYDNSYTDVSVGAFAAALASGTEFTDAVELLEKVEQPYIKPERVRVMEVGYRSLIGNKLYIDLNYYYNQYFDFMGIRNVVHPLTGNTTDASGALDIINGDTKYFQLFTNANAVVTSRGVGLALNYALPRGFRLGGSYNFADFSISENADPNFEAGFNTPKHRFGATIENRRVTKNFGFKASFRWSDSYRWESAFGDGDVDSYHVLDLQLSYKLPKIHSTFKLGAANLLNREYQQSFGAPHVGAQYYAAFTYDGFLSNN